jgi:hypothetical protein
MKNRLISAQEFLIRNRMQIFLFLLATCCFFLVIPLIFHAYAGSFMRLNGDDYCYGATQAKYGFWGAQRYAYEQIGQLYNGNRYSLNLSLAIMGLFPPKLYAVTPGAAILLWLLSILFFLYQLKLFFGLRLHNFEMLFCGLSLIFFTLYFTRDVTQILYWYTGMSTYFMPLVIIILLFGLIFRAARSHKVIFFLPLIFFVAFLAGGFSETTALLQLCCLGILALLAGFSHRRREISGLFLPVFFALLATILSIIVLAFSPSIKVRLGMHNHPALIELFVLTLRYSFDFLYTSLASLPLPYSLILIQGLLYSLVRKATYEIPDKVLLNPRVVGLFVIGCFLAVAASFAPSIYAQYAYPGERAILPSRFIQSIALFGIGFYLGTLFPAAGLKFKESFRPYSFLVFFLYTVALGVYSIRAVIPIAAQIPKFQRWAYIWDIRDQEIREDKQNGIRDVNVIQIDHVIYDVAELSANPLDVYNECAAVYYGVNSITADLPGWDP